MENKNVFVRGYRSSIISIQRAFVVHYVQRNCLCIELKA